LWGISSSEMQLIRNTDRQPMPKVSKAINPQVKRKRIKQSTKKEQQQQQ
jgi:hypothetical protein